MFSFNVIRYNGSKLTFITHCIHLWLFFELDVLCNFILKTFYFVKSLTIINNLPS